MMVASDSFDDFGREVISDSNAFVNRISEEEYAIYRANTQGIAFDDAKASDDRVLRDFAHGLDDSWRLFDLRPSNQSRGFARLAVDDIRRHKTELVFAHRTVKLPPTRAWWRPWAKK